MRGLSWVLALLAALSLTGCSTSSGGVPTLSGIQVTPGTPSVAAGLTQQFTATGSYSDGSTKDLTSSATWKSSSTAAALVSASGLATSKAQGTATITATSGGVSGTATLTVTAPVLASINVTPIAPSVAAGLTQQLTATGVLTDGNTTPLTSAATWSSSATAVATVDSAGLATSHTQGSANIIATSGSISGSAALTVTAPTLTSMVVNPLTASIAPTTTKPFTATGTFTDGSMRDVTSSVTWTSSSTTVATISDTVPTKGLAKALVAGSSTITATSGAIVAMAALTVTSATLNSINVTPVNLSVPLGVLQQYTATGSFSDGTTQDITNIVTWTSSGTNIASITTSGLATALNLGTVTITATSGATSANTSLNVNAANLASLVVTPGNSTIAPGTGQKFNAVGTFNDGGTRNLTGQVVWSSSNTGVATIGAGNGTAKAVATGTTFITATLGSTMASTSLNVSSATIASISVTPSSRTIAPGSKLGFTATGMFSDSSTQVISSDVTWASDATAVATVNNVGTATGVAAGTANISATLGAVSGSASINVSTATLVSLAVNPSSAVLAPASTLVYQAVGTYSDGSTQNLTNAVTWSSSDSNVVSITTSGTATGQSAGSAVITAQLGSVSGTANVIVSTTALQSIAITPLTASIPAQVAVQFTATATFTDGSTQNLTNSVTWTSSKPAIATISDAVGNHGLAVGATPGSSTMTAAFGGVVGTATLTVTNATLTSITVTPSGPTITLGNTQQFTATGHFSDATTQNITNQATWTSSDIHVAVMSSSGLGTGAGSGSATITAGFAGGTGTAVLTVQ